LTIKHTRRTVLYGRSFHLRKESHLGTIQTRTKIMIKLIVEPSTPPMEWRDFYTSKERRSIALDGYVSTGPRFRASGPHANFNHHEEVSRLETRATCAQVLLAIRQGLFRTFVNERGVADAILYVNDCDEDVSLSVFLLQYYHLAIESMNPRLNKLVFMEDMLDTTAGAYPFPTDMKTLEQLMWVFAPYHLFRVSGGLDSRDAGAFRNIIESVGQRIMTYIAGDPGSVELDTRFERLGGGKGWSLVSEQGQNARIGLYNAGIFAFISVRQRKDRMWNYSIGRSSQFVPFPIPKILKRLNIAEDRARQANSNLNDVWGGSDTIAGSPRIYGSALNPEQVTEVIEETLNS
jgi:hypothetical protein